MSRTDLADLEAGKAVVIVVTLHHVVVDIVVAETAEIEIGERLAAVAVCGASGAVEPDRGVAPPVELLRGNESSAEHGDKGPKQWIGAGLLAFIASAQMPPTL